MIRLFLYHSDPEILTKMQREMAEYFRGVRHTFQITASLSYKGTLAYLQSQPVRDDIFFFDCGNQKEALQLAAALRERELYASWVYVGKNREALLRMLLLRPSAFLPDPAQTEHLCFILKRLDHYHQIQQKKLYFSFKCDGEWMRIPYDEISYFESNAKKVILRKENGGETYYFTAKLDDIEQELPSFFLRCHQSYLVNMHKIRSLDTRERTFLLFSGEEILISRRMYTEAKERYQNFL